MSWTVLPGKNVVYTQTQLPPQALEGLDYRQGESATVVRHNYHAWQRMRDRGMVVPNPMAHYDWPGRWTPRANQRTTAQFLVEHPKAVCLNGMRTGKTMSALWARDYLHQEGAVRRTLIIAPLSTLDTVWERNLFLHFPGRTFAVLKGTRAQKQQRAADTRVETIIVNPDSLHLVMDHLPELDLVIVDEATAFKNAQSRRWKCLNALVQKSEARLWLLTATPTAQGPMDAYGLIRLIQPKYLSKRMFQDMTMTQVSKFKWVPKPDAEKTVVAWLQPAIRYTLEDCGDVPTVQYEYIPYDLSSEQRRVIDDLREEALATFGDDGVDVTAANAAALLSKMLQVEAGGVYAHDPDGERVVYHMQADGFFDAAREYVEEADTPVLVFTPFRAAAFSIHAALKKAGLAVGLVTGDTRHAERTELFDQFQAGQLRAIVAVPATMSHGLTLDRANYVLWAGPTFKAEEYSQANGRLLEAESSKHIVVSHLVATGVAKEAFARLKSHARLQDTVLNLIQHGV